MRYLLRARGGSIWLSGPIIFIFTFPELSAILQILRNSSSSGLIPLLKPIISNNLLKWDRSFYLIVNLANEVFCIHGTFERSHTIKFLNFKHNHFYCGQTFQKFHQTPFFWLFRPDSSSLP